MPDRPRSNATWPGWHKRKIDDQRKGLPQHRAVTVGSVGFYQQDTISTPAEHPFPAVVMSIPLDAGDWVVTAGAWGYFEGVYLGVAGDGLGLAGGWVGYSLDAGASPAAGTFPPLLSTSDSPTVVEIAAAIRGDPGNDLQVHVHIVPLPSEEV